MSIRQSPASSMVVPPSHPDGCGRVVDVVEVDVEVDVESAVVDVEVVVVEVVDVVDWIVLVVVVDSWPRAKEAT